jgi:hypothetical protein
VEWICDRTGQWIAEHSRSLIKGDPVLSHVAGSLGRIPCEPHLLIVLETLP